MEMKKIYSFLSAALLGVSMASAAGIEVTFNGSDSEGWTAGDNGVVANGYLSAPLGETNGKYRQDVKATDLSYTIPAASEKVLAIKFIGTLPAGTKVTLEMDNDGSWLKDYVSNPEKAADVWNNKNFQKIITTGGNTIYCFDLTKASNFEGNVAVTKLNIKIADATEPGSYSIDWVKTFADNAAVEAAKDWKDDGANDTDEANAVAMPVENQTSGAGFTTLKDAIDAANEGDVILVNEDQSYGQDGNRLTISGKTITIKGADGVSIKRTTGGKINMLVNSNSNVTFENIIFDGANIEATAYFFEVNGAEVTFKDCKIANFNNAEGYAIQAKSNGKAHFEGLTTESSTLKGTAFIGSAGTTVTGDNDITLYLEKTNTISASELTNTKPITLLFEPELRAEAAVLVKGWDNTANFACGVYGYELTASEGNIAFTVAAGVDAIENAEETFVNVYSLQGVLLRENVSAEAATEGLASGLYIVGGKKVYVK